MNQEKLPEDNQEQVDKKINPNSIGELLSIGKDLPTRPDRVYRSVNTQEAIDDIETSGVVRNKQSAGLVPKSRWGERVFWSKGEEGKYHSVNGYLIEAPLSVATERIVTREDITAIYTKNENGEVIDILKHQIENEQQEMDEEAAESEERDKARIEEIKRDLGIVNKI